MIEHGFRTTASTLLNEQGWSPDPIERQLSHAPRDKIRAVYNRAQYLDERRRMMQSWADYLDTLKSGKSADVIPIRRSLNTWLLSCQIKVAHSCDIQMLEGVFIDQNLRNDWSMKKLFNWSFWSSGIWLSKRHGLVFTQMFGKWDYLYYWCYRLIWRVL